MTSHRTRRWVGIVAGFGLTLIALGYMFWLDDYATGDGLRSRCDGAPLGGAGLVVTALGILLATSVIPSGRPHRRWVRTGLVVMLLGLSIWVASLVVAPCTTYRP